MAVVRVALYAGLLVLSIVWRMASEGGGQLPPRNSDKAAQAAFSITALRGKRMVKRLPLPTSESICSCA